MGSLIEGPVLAAEGVFTPIPFFDGTEGFIIYSPYLIIPEVKRSCRPELTGLIPSGIVPALFTDSGLNVTIAAIDCRARMGLKRDPGSFTAASAVYRKSLAAGAEIFAGILILDMLAFFSLAAWGTTPGYINEPPTGM